MIYVIIGIIILISSFLIALFTLNKESKVEREIEERVADSSKVKQPAESVHDESFQPILKKEEAISKLEEAIASESGRDNYQEASTGTISAGIESGLITSEVEHVREDEEKAVFPWENTSQGDSSADDEQSPEDINRDKTLLGSDSIKATNVISIAELAKQQQNED